MDKLPADFLIRMQQYLGQEFKVFVATYAEPRTQGLRANTLKLAGQTLLNLVPWSLQPVPWTRDGFYFAEEVRPGRHPYHAAGLYYIQEPSAMAVAAALAPEPGQKVLDLCAAPGGKSTHLAALLRGEGLLVANEIHPGRVKILAENLERWGVKNVVVTNETPEKLARVFSGFFDRILVDAPCSGEGMFRKDPEACNEWSVESVTHCAGRQLEILEQAAGLLKPGGILAYSTCTFAPEENEGVLAKFLCSHPEFSILKVPGFPGFAPGQPQWVGAGPELTGATRLWPHRLKGEGHFLALLLKTESSGLDEQAEKQLARKLSRKPDKQLTTDLKSKLDYYYSFARENLTVLPQGEFTFYGDNLYLVPPGVPNLGGLKVTRPGWHLGVVKKNRFAPSHALALSLTAGQTKRNTDLPGGAPETLSYLRGEALAIPGDKGWTLVTVDGYPLGWGKQDGTLLKNHYPKGLRWL